MAKNKKKRVDVVYSTNPDYDYSYDGEDEAETLPANQQTLKMAMERKGRGGKTATVITGFIGSSDDLNDLARLLKNRCGTGGSAKDGEIIMQGDIRPKVRQVLEKEGYRVKG